MLDTVGWMSPKLLKWLNYSSNPRSCGNLQYGASLAHVCTVLEELQRDSDYVAYVAHWSSSEARQQQQQQQQQ